VFTVTWRDRLAVAHDSRRQHLVAATQAQIDGAATIPANANVRLAITAVGTTFPGADLGLCYS